MSDILVVDDVGSILEVIEIDHVVLVDGDLDTLLLDPQDDQVLVDGSPGLRGPQGDQGPTGPQGPAGADGAPGGSYVHAQLTPEAVWTVVHNLGFHPAVSVIDSGGNLVVGDVARVSDNELTITFSSAFAGTAYLS